MELEIEKAKIHNEKSDTKYNSVPIRLKLQPYNHAGNEDIVTFLSEFSGLALQAGWAEEVKMLQLRTLLTGEARVVAIQAHGSYEELSKALTERYGKRPYQYFKLLQAAQKEPQETYRGLWARIEQYLARFVDTMENPLDKFKEEFFLNALPTSQAQWIRRNKGSGSVVEAAEDYILPDKYGQKPKQSQVSHHSFDRNKSEIKKENQQGQSKNCFNCGKYGHFARKCPKRKNNSNMASYLVQQYSGGLIHVPGEVNGRDISFVKDTGAAMTLIREDLVDPKYVLGGQRETLYTAIGQPFSAKLAVVQMDTPFYRGHAQVGLVPDLAAEALLGIDIIERKGVNVITRQQRRERELEDIARGVAMNCQGKAGLATEDDHGNHHIEEEAYDGDDGRDHSDHPEVFSVDEDANENTRPDTTGGDNTDEEDACVLGETVELSNVNAEVLSRLQSEDPTLANIRRKSAVSADLIHDDRNAIYWENGILKRKWESSNGIQSGVQVVLPERLRLNVIKLAHERPLAGHLGAEKTKERVLTAFYWPGVFKDITEYCSTCDICQKVAKRRSDEKAPLVQPPIVGEPFYKISMDVVGPLSKSKKGNRFILTIMDDATRYPEAFALRNVDAVTVADTLIDMFSRVGFPKVILTDQGTNFTSELLKHLYEVTGIKGITTSPYHPQANGKVERFNATLKAILKKLSTSNKDEWDTLLPYALFAYREVPHEETGFSPFEMLYGWPVRGPLQILEKAMTGEAEIQTNVVDHVVKMRERLAEIRETVQETLVIKRQKIKQWYDQNATQREFRPGDEVLLLLPSDTSKMVAQWKGPYRVIRQQPYRIPQSKREEVKRLIDDMLEKGQISPSASPYSAPVVLVEKPDKSIRLCVDYRKLNEITQFDG
ncbi:uncharacterized protein [Argopecten irradians]|uniref:uncharacterized protein n=1 Tax=Argopecten irradians TaxID=31199 RepID=UPI00372482DA